MIRRGLVALALCSASPALAEMPRLHSPIDCDLNGPCYIQQYMDRDPGAGHTDYLCQSLSYDRHRGTDFALPNREMMRQGVNVLAAAPGTVRGYRDGMSDEGYNEETRPVIGKRACGNGVVIEHGNNWSTQYCHLKNGSIQVRRGQRVEVGDVLGQVGQSGRAEFPHVHFTLRKSDVPLDPFSVDGKLSCGSDARHSAWVQEPPYRPGGIIDLGFATEVPEYQDVKEGTAGVTEIDPLAPAMVTYAFSFGTRGGDIMRIRVEGPEGIIIAHDTELKRNHAQAFRAVGKKRRVGRKWPTGLYRATASLLREGEIVNSLTREIEIK